MILIISLLISFILAIGSFAAIHRPPFNILIDLIKENKTEVFITTWALGCLVELAIKLMLL
jgi:hypothetical protein